MPWTARDADRHVEGLSAGQRRIWARVANDALKRCMTNGGSTSACEGRAVRQANAVAQRAPKSMALGLAQSKVVASKAEDFKLSSDTETAGYVEAAFSIFGEVDSDRDIVEPTAFKDGQEVPMVWAHDWQRPVGKGKISVDGRKRAVFSGGFFLNTEAGREAYETVKAMGSLQQWSWGFRVTDASQDNVDGEPIRRIKGADVYEVSPVLVGANRNTHTLLVKSDELADDGSDIDDAALAELIRAVDEEEKAAWDAAYINDLPDSAFAVVLPGGEKDDSGKTTPRNLRKLPHHNADGSLDMPHLRNALARLEQADLPDDAKGTARAHLERHANAEGVGDRGKAYDPDTDDTSDDPSPSLTMEEEADVTLASASAYLSRVGALAALRRSEGKVGRAISRARLERLNTLEGALRSAANHIRDLIAEAEPKPAEGDGEDDESAKPKKADASARLLAARLRTQRLRTATITRRD
jgi:HK97 family phage prohead protease